MLKPLLIAWITVCATHWHVDPELAMAVANVESRKGKKEFRVGRLGRSKFYGPFGIHKCFLKKWPIDLWSVNCWIGCRALRNCNRKKGLAFIKRRLKKYNAKFNQVYWKAILRAWERYENE